MIEKAKKDYLEGMKYKDLAEKYDVSINTVKSWVKRYSWAKLKKGTKGCTQNKKGAHKEKVQESAVKTSKEVVKDIDKEIVEEVLENDELTDKQRLFCLYYIKYFNATKAYQKAYECSYTTALVAGPRLLGNARVKQQIEELKANRFEGAYLDSKDLLQMHIDIIRADVTDFSEFGIEEVPVMDPETGKQKIDEDGNLVFYKRNYLNFKDSSEVDGTLISEIKMGKDGPVLKLHDKRNSLNFLTAHKGLMSELDKEKLQIAKDKHQLEKDRVTKDTGEEDNQGVQDFIKATTMTEEEIEELFNDEDE